MKKVTLIIGLIFFCSALIFSQEQKAEKIQLTLNECILKALESNLDISVEALNTEISDVSISQAKEAFMPRLSFGYDKWNYNQLSNWWVQGTQYTTKRDYFSLGLTQKIITGGEISLGLSNLTTNTTQRLTIINPYYRGELRINFQQPLLKNFGPKIARTEIKKAQNQREISEYNLKSTLIQKIYEVEEAYWNLVYAIETLKVRKLSLEQSKQRLNRTKEAARIGIKSAIDVLASETEVARGEDNLLYAKLQVERNEERLKEIINLPTDPLGITGSILPLDKPSVVKKEITLEEALKTALKERPEISRYQIEIENNNLDVSYYKNQLLPQLDLELNLSYPGQSGDKLIYKDNNPYTGIVVNKIKGSRADSFKDVFNFTYDNWQVRLNLTIPLENIFSRASLAKARIEKEKNLLEMEKSKKNYSL